MNLSRKLIAWSVLMIALSLSACGGGAAGGASSGAGGEVVAVTPSDEAALSAALVNQGMPADVAKFFAAVKVSSNCTNTTTCNYLYTYPNGAKRELTLTVIPNQRYTPTTEELGRTASLAKPVYNSTFAASGVKEPSPPADTIVSISYFVPASSAAKNSSVKAQVLPLAKRNAAISASGPSDGFQISWSESGTKGADVAIGSVLEHFADAGITGYKTGNVYAAASALSDIAGSALISKQVNAWMAELADLEKCASDPTNPITQSNPTYTAATLAHLRSTRDEIKVITAVRFINVMGETSEGIHPATAILSIPLKQAHSWTEQSLQDSSEKLMQDARSSVVSCKPSCPANFSATGVSESRIDVSWAASTTSSGVNSATNYILYGGNANGVSTGDTVWPDIGLRPSTNYCYTVSAFNSYGKSENCPQKCGQTKGPPVVNGSTPYADSKNVPVGTAITATFSEAMDAGTISSGTLTLAGTGGVAGTVSYSGMTATFTPSGNLEKGKLYTATVTTGVKDLDGVAMKENFTWSFTTENSNADYTGEITFTTSDGSTKAVGTGTVAWSLVKTTAGGDKYYLPSGTVNATFTHANCSQVNRTIAIDTQTNQGMGLIVYAADSYFASSYHFKIYAGMSPRALAKTMCNGTETEIDTPVVFDTMVCNGAYTLTPYTTTTGFSGRYQCNDGTNVTDVLWNFVR